MDYLLSIVNDYGYLAVFALVFLQELGVPNPVPNELVLLFAGALTTIGELNYWLMMLIVVIADVAGTSLLYFAFYFFEKSIMELLPKWLPINEQLVLHLYGLAAPIAAQNPPSWDLLARKLLGYVVLFAWQDQTSFEQIKLGLEQITARAETALIVAANVAAADLPALQALRNKSIFVNQQGQLTFYQEDDPQSIKKVLLALVDLLLERAE